MPRTEELDIGKLLGSRRAVGIAALAAGVFCWGVTPVLIRRLTPFVDAWTANGLRYPISAVLYFPVLWHLKKSGKLTKDLIGNCSIPALLSIGGQIFWALAHYELQASEIGFFARMSTAWAIFGAMILFRDERQLLKHPKFLVGLTVIFAGFLVMSLIPDVTAVANSNLPDIVDRHGLAKGNYRLGVTWAMLASAFFGLYIASIRRCVPDVHPVYVFSVVGQIVSVGMILGMLCWGDVSSITRQTPFSWSLIVASSIMGIGVGHVLVYTAVQRLGASITSSCQSVLPFATVAVASVTLSERLLPQQWIGGVFMIFGALVLLSINHEIKVNNES